VSIAPSLDDLDRVLSRIDLEACRRSPYHSGELQMVRVSARELSVIKAFLPVINRPAQAEIPSH